eukprot:972232_1
MSLDDDLAINTFCYIDDTLYGFIVSIVNPRCYRVLDLGDGQTKQISADRLSKILDTSIITSLQSQHPDCNNPESPVAVTIDQTNTVNNKKGGDTMQDGTNCFNLNRMVVWVLITMAWTANGLVLAGLSLNASNELFVISALGLVI